MLNYDIPIGKDLQPIDELPHEDVRALRKPLIAFLDGIESSKALTEIAHPTRRWRKLKDRVAYLKQPFETALAVPVEINGLSNATAFIILSMCNAAKARHAHSLGRLRKNETLESRGEGHVRGQFVDIVMASLLNRQQVEHQLYNLIAEAKYKKKNLPEIRARELSKLTLSRHADELIYQPFNSIDKLGLKFKPLVDCFEHDFFQWRAPR